MKNVSFCLVSNLSPVQITSLELVPHGESQLVSNKGKKLQKQSLSFYLSFPTNHFELLQCTAMDLNLSQGPICYIVLNTPNDTWNISSDYSHAIFPCTIYHVYYEMCIVPGTPLHNLSGVIYVLFQSTSLMKRGFIFIYFFLW